MFKKQRKKKDPHHKREASKYKHPVPSREFIEEYLKELRSPASFEQLLKAFSLKTEDEYEGLRRRLQAMLRDGQLILNRAKQYGLIDKMSLVAGTT